MQVVGAREKKVKLICYKLSNTGT